MCGHGPKISRSRLSIFYFHRTNSPNPWRPDLKENEAVGAAIWQNHLSHVFGFIAIFVFHRVFSNQDGPSRFFLHSGFAGSYYIFNMLLNKTTYCYISVIYYMILYVYFIFVWVHLNKIQVTIDRKFRVAQPRSRKVHAGMAAKHSRHRIAMPTSRMDNRFKEVRTMDCSAWNISHKNHRIHGAGIHANIWGILMGSMWPYIAYMDPMGIDGRCIITLQYTIVFLPWWWSNCL